MSVVFPFLRGIGPMALLFSVCFATVVWAQSDEAVLVQTDAVRTQNTSQTAEVIGRMVATEEAVLAARIDGTITEVRVRAGDRVANGGVLMRLDDEPLQARVRLARANLAAAQAQLTTNRARLKLGKQERDRLARLRTTASASKASYEDAVQNVVIAEATIGESQALIAAREASLRLAELNLQYAVVKAPYDGVVTEISNHVGAYARVGTPLLRVLSDASLEIEADVPATYLAGLNRGLEVSAQIAQVVAIARVRAVIPQENRLTRTRAVRFAPRFTGAQPLLAANQSVIVRIPVGKPRRVVSVHKDAVIKRKGESLVFVVVDGKAAERAVRLGEAVGARFEVLSGLRPGDQAITRGNERMRAGTPVQVAAAPS